MEPTTSFSARLDAEYKLLWQRTSTEDASGPSDDAWQAPITAYFELHPDPELPLTEWDPERKRTLNAVALKYHESGTAYLSRLDETKLASVFVAMAPKSFRSLVSVPGPALNATGPYLFPLKTCLSMWGEMEALNLSDDARMELFLEVAEQWGRLEGWFSEFEKNGITPLHGEDFWRQMVFQTLVQKYASLGSSGPDTVAADSSDGIDAGLLYDSVVEKTIFDLQQLGSLQLSYSRDQVFPRMFLVSREPSGYGLPPGVAIPEETQLYLYSAWSGLETQPAVKLIRSRVREAREKMDELFSLGLLSSDPADQMHYKQAVFENLLITLIQGEPGFYKTLIGDYDKKIAAGREWQKSVAALGAAQETMTAFSQKLTSMDERMLALAKQTLTASQNLPSWYSPESLVIDALNASSLGLQTFESGKYQRADETALDLSGELADRAEFVKKLPADKKECLATLRNYLTARIGMLRAAGIPEAAIQAELYAAYQGAVADFKDPLPYVYEAFSTEFLKSLGLDFSNFENGDPVQKAEFEGRWNDAWDAFNRGLEDDFWTFKIDGVYSTLPPDPGGGYQEPCDATHWGTEGPRSDWKVTPEPERLSWRIQQLGDLMARDPDFAVFNDFMTDTQPLVAVLNALLNGMHDDETNTDLLGYLHPDMNRPEEAVVLLKKMAGGLHAKYFSGGNVQANALKRAFGKLSKIFGYLKPERMNLTPEQEQVLGALQGMAALFEPGQDGKCPLQSLTETVIDPGFTTYSFKRALLVYGPDIAGAVAGAVLIGMATGGLGLIPEGGGLLLAGIRLFGVTVRSSLVLTSLTVSVGGVGGKEIARMGMEVLHDEGLVGDYGAASLATQYTSGKISGDMVFERIFGAAGRSFFELLGFKRTDPNTGLGHLLERLDSGQLDLQGFVFSLIGEYGYQAAMMAGVSVFARGLGKLAEGWLASESTALVLLGRSVQKFAGLFDSLSDRIVMGTLGASELSLVEFGKMFCAEFAEEIIEQSAGHVSPWLEFMVSVLNSSRVNYDPTESTLHFFNSDEDGTLIKMVYKKGKIEELLRKLNGFKEKNQNIETKEDGTVIFTFTDADGKTTIQEYHPSDTPLALRQGLMERAGFQMPDDVLAELGITGWNSDGDPIWVEGADINAAIRTLRTLGFVVTEEIRGGGVSLKISWTSGNVASSFILPAPGKPASGDHASVPANVVRRGMRLTAPNKSYLVYWSGTEETFVEDVMDDADGGHAMNTNGASQMSLAAVFQQGPFLSAGLITTLIRRARLTPGNPQTIRVFDTSSDPANPAYADYRYVWGPGGLTVDHVGGTANVTGEVMAFIDQKIDEELEREAKAMEDAVAGSAD